MEAALVLASLVASAGRAGVRLVLRAAVGRVAHHAHAGVCTDHLGRVLPVGQPDRRQQRHHRRVAFGLVGPGRALYWLTLTLVALGVLLLRRCCWRRWVTPCARAR